MKLHITGVSHKTAPVEVRECLAFREETLPAALADLKAREGVAEAVILSTCNRVEVTVTTEDNVRPASHRRFLPGRSQGVSPQTIAPHLYRHEGRDAIHHLFRVAASLDSMVVGEPQILGQLKAAYAAAKDCGALCGWLDGLMTRAFGVAKRVRSETGVGQMAVSVSYAAVELARKIFGSLANRTIMIVGAGKMSELAARHLRRSGASHVFVTNRTHERAVEMAALFQGTPVEYTRFVGHAARSGYRDRQLGRAALHPAQGRDAARHRRAPQQAHVPDRYRGAAQYRARRSTTSTTSTCTISTTCRRW
jgi:glutamyl-tRNA reductase